MLGCLSPKQPNGTEDIAEASGSYRRLWKGPCSGTDFRGDRSACSVSAPDQLHGSGVGGWFIRDLQEDTDLLEARLSRGQKCLRYPLFLC